MPMLEVAPTVKSRTTDLTSAPVALVNSSRTGNSTTLAGNDIGVPARYEVLSEVGAGGMGIVYKVHDVETDEVLALKILKPEIASDPSMRENLRHEVCLARKVTHKNVCRIHEFHRSEATACISMEYVEGQSLLAKLHERQRFPVDEAVKLARQMCAGLREAHSQGIVHRDLKPANIMIDEHGNLKIMDFGIARLTQGTMQMTTTLVGTPEYMSPEQVELKAITFRTDVYALGLVLYEMVTGVRAFSGDSAIAVAVQQLRKMPRGPSEIVPDLAPEIEAIILKCLCKEPAKRYESVAALDEALERFMVEQGAEAHTRKIDLDTLIQKGFAKSQTLASRVGTLAGQISRATLQPCNIALAPMASKMVARSKEFLTPARRRSLQLAGVLGAVFFTTAITFGFMTRSISHSRKAAAAALAGASTSTAISLTHPPIPANALPQPNPSLAAVAEDAKEAEDFSDAPAPAKAGKRVPASQNSFAAMMKQAKSRAKAVDAGSTLASTLPLPITATAASNSLLLAGAEAPKPVDVAALAAAKADTKADALPEPTYLEVGSFKDTKWADSAVNQLAGLGFHALSVHKGKLFLQSYHVQVGPYATRAELDAAEQKLTAKGFTPRAVK